MLEQITLKLYYTLSVAVKQSQYRSKPYRLCGVGDSARPRLQEPDRERGRAAAARRGVGGLDQRVIDTAVRD